jgi:hypothetical protein
VDSSSSSRTQRVLFSSVPICTLLDALLAEYLLHRTFNSSVFLRAPLHLLNALLAELSESSVILFLLQTHSRVPSSVHSLHWLNAHLAELYRTPQRFCLLLNSQQSSSNCTLCICSMPTWQSSTEFTAEFCLQLCLSYTALPPRYSTTLRSSS